MSSHPTQEKGARRYVSLVTYRPFTLRRLLVYSPPPPPPPPQLSMHAWWLQLMTTQVDVSSVLTKSCEKISERCQRSGVKIHPVAALITGWDCLPGVTETSLSKLKTCSQCSFVCARACACVCVSVCGGGGGVRLTADDSCNGCACRSSVECMNQAFFLPPPPSSHPFFHPHPTFIQFYLYWTR